MAQQKVDNFERKFMQAKQLLGQHRTHKALPIFKKLWKNDPKNFNLNYLLGICYQEEYPKSDSAIEYLKFASNKVNSDYDPESPDERYAPPYVHYFLVISYSRLERCKKAKKQKEEFLSIYDKQNYTRDVKKWVEKCGKKERKDDDTLKVEKKNAELSKLSSSDTMLPVHTNNNIDHKKNADIDHKKRDSIQSVPFAKRDMVTTGVEYSKGSELYGIQVGAFSKLVPKSSFTDLKNIVEYHLDDDGMIRAVIGSFNRKAHAKNVLKVVQEEGYEDAFIVNLSEKKKKNSKELLVVDGVRLKEKISGKVNFKVQIGVYKGKIPKKLARNYLELKDIEEHAEEGNKVITSGNFHSYDK
ncbi:MAG: hypothetical protein ABEH43_10145, partial [Flavobacteriales bacterium]